MSVPSTHIDAGPSRKTRSVAGAATTKQSSASPHGDHHGRSPLRRAIALTKLRPSSIVWAVTAGALCIGASIALGAIAAWLIVRASQRPPVLWLETAIVGVRLFGISKGLFRYLERLASHKVALDGMTELRVGLYERLAAGKDSTLASLRQGDILARVGKDVDDVGDLVVRGIIPALTSGVVVLGAVIAMTIILPWAGLILFFSLVAAGTISPILSMRSAQAAEETGSAARARVSAAALTMLDHGDELAVNGALERQLAELDDGEAALKRSQDKATKPTALAAALLDVFTGIAVIGSLLVGIPAVNHGALSFTCFAVVILTPLAAFEAVATLPAAAIQVFRSRAAAIRITAMLDDAEDTTNRVFDDADIPEDAPLEARDLVCAWPNSPTVLEKLSFSVRPGQTLGIVGPSGVGKTTLLTTLSGLLEPRSGFAGFADHGIASMSRRHAADLVTYIAEDAHIFATTILENLRVVRGDTTEAEARAALETTGLTRWLADLPDGLNTVLGQGGTTISGGERRRLLLARALLSPARFIILDEPGEHLDTDSADRLTRSLIDIARHTGRGMVIVSHRLSTLEGADTIAILRNHRLVHVGSPQELVKIDPEYRAVLEAE